MANPFLFCLESTAKFLDLIKEVHTPHYTLAQGDAGLVLCWTSLLDQVQKMSLWSKTILKDQENDSLENGVLPLSSNTTDLQVISQASSQRKGRGLSGRQWFTAQVSTDKIFGRPMLILSTR